MYVRQVILLRALRPSAAVYPIVCLMGVNCLILTEPDGRDHANYWQSLSPGGTGRPMHVLRNVDSASAGYI